MTASADKTARLWDPETGACKQVLEGHTDEIFSCAFNYEGNTIITGKLFFLMLTYHDLVSMLSLTPHNHHHSLSFFMQQTRFILPLFHPIILPLLFQGHSLIIFFTPHYPSTTYLLNNAGQSFLLIAYMYFSSTFCFFPFLVFFFSKRHYLDRLETKRCRSHSYFLVLICVLFIHCFFISYREQRQYLQVMEMRQ